MTSLGEQTALLIPTLNGGALWRECVAAIRAQTLRPARILVADSSSDDDTVEVARAAGFEVMIIDRATFDHGGTRQMLAEMASPLPVLVYLTQDAVLDTPESLARIVGHLTSAADIGAVCGRQLPHRNASPIAAHARLCNYPAASRIVRRNASQVLGIKAVYMSNSFSAYRREALTSVGGFPSKTIFGEDMLTAARMVLGGWAIAYSGDATVQHSHDYSIPQDFRRAFDIGVMHTHDHWLLKEFGKAEGEGFAFVCSEVRYLAATRPMLIPLSLLHSAAKFSGYKLGRMYRHLPAHIVPRLSMHSRWWAKQEKAAAV